METNKKSISLLTGGQLLSSTRICIATETIYVLLLLSLLCLFVGFRFGFRDDAFFFFLFPPFSFHLVFDCSLIALRWKQTKRVETRRLCKARSESNQELFDVFHYKFFYIFTTDRIDVGCALFMSCVVHFRTHPETAQKPHQSTEKERKKKKQFLFFLHIYVHCNEFFQKYLFSSTYRRRCICCSVCSFYLLLLLRYLMFLKKAPFVYIYIAIGYRPLRRRNEPIVYTYLR